MTDRGLGLVALGDSITNGGGNMARGVYPRSWAHWLALALGLPYSGLGADGARAPHVLRHQVPRLRGGYDVGALYVGVNDARGPDWDAPAFARDVGAVLGALAPRCARTLVLTVPRDLGRPRAGAKVDEANAVLRDRARDAGAEVVALDDLRGWRLVLPDGVHPSAVGQVEIAERAARVLGVAGVPTALAEPDSGARAELGWARAWGRMWIRDRLRRARERRP